jgi:P-type E1-E2 ATPase
MKDFQKFVPREALVTRDGEIKRIDVSKLVIGDIVHIKGGSNIPADIVLIESSDLKVN